MYRLSESPRSFDIWHPRETKLTRRISRREAPDTMKILAAKSDLEKAEEVEAMNALGQKHDLRKTVVRTSIVTLALGFTLLGLLSLLNKHQVCAESGLTFENALSIIGGTTSFMLGGLFLIVGVFHWDHSGSLS
jgi:hypothetical protein